MPNMRPPKLTDKQKERLKILEPKFLKSINDKDLIISKELAFDIQNVLRPTGHITKLITIKNRLYELAIELNELDFAIDGFNSGLKHIAKNTRVYLETSALLAICYLRKEDLENAKPLIKEVLTNDNIIKSERTRKIFKKEMIERFDEEIALYSLKNKNIEHFTDDELENEISRIISTLNEDEIYNSLGKSVPQHTKYLLFQVHEFSTKQLPSAERLSLPSPEDKIKDNEVGKTIFNSVKRVIYNSICDKESEIYKAWYENGMKLILSKGYIKSIVITSLVNIGIGLKMLTASIISLIIRFGLDVYCEHYKPTDLMELRGK